ncbi:hypothetical protein MLD38_038253 [Melastoma candidum]|uniref:Uncharacterized protein n=1 Tax=Melastoma candidum TaxID=119954 RepID=A0ACB9KZI0_9MYRT|nr:hypothetical protein MLD38_038253 [Melastoma candidum]
MAFHVGCPITCRRICYCSLGFPRPLQKGSSRDEFLHGLSAVQHFLGDPWGITARGCDGTLQVPVPKVLPPPLPPPTVAAAVPEALGAPGYDAVDEALVAASAQAKRAALQKKAAAAMVAAEDFARRFESGDVMDIPDDHVGEELVQGHTNSTKILCRMCLFGETDGSERAKKMLSCKNCGKKYHRSCLKSWSHDRDLFHWSAWTCPACRTCEICRRTGDPKKFMFCKRCDGAYHCYCQHPPHKNISSGPYLCPKHTKCHSCGSNVPGNGLSVRWFLQYSCCDACGRLFVKGNYCPVCLKVYRDSESTPMVCCDNCQRWVHTHCDDISDDKYMQFQVDGNLQYICPTCRGECYQVKDLEDAVQELWRRKDYADKDLIASLRAAAGLPTQEEIFSISPYSDDDESGPIISKGEYGRSLKFSLKALNEKSPKKTKEHGKKASGKKKFKKKGLPGLSSGPSEVHKDLQTHVEAQSSSVDLSKDNNNDAISGRGGVGSSFNSNTGASSSLAEVVCSINQPGVLKHKFIEEVTAGTDDRKPRVVHIKSSKPPSVEAEVEALKLTSKSKAVNEKKLVIHLGGRNRNATDSPRSDASSCQKEPDLLNSKGVEYTSLQKNTERSIVIQNIGEKLDVSGQGTKDREKDGNQSKFGKVFSRNTGDRGEKNSTERTRLVFRKRNAEGETPASEIISSVNSSRSDKASPGMQMVGRQEVHNERISEPTQTPSSQNSAKDTKPLLKLKFKNISRDSPSSQLPPRDEEKSSVKGQRSKRKRPSPAVSKNANDEDGGASQSRRDYLVDEIMDANWILKKLGKDAIGKGVEIHQASDKTWHKGVVADVTEGTSTLSVKLDDGRVKKVELGTQGVRFVSKKQKRTKL